MRLQDRLKELRTLRQLTLKDLAQISGLSVSYLSDIERGRTVPTISTLEVLANALEITMIDLLTGVDFAGEVSQQSLPPGLAELVDDEVYGKDIDQDWIETLSKIQMRGKRPQTKLEWLELYLHLRRILD